MMYEMWTCGALPYAGMIPQRVWAEVISGYRLTRPSECPGPVFEVIQQCWLECGQRPLFSSLVETISALHSVSLTSDAEYLTTTNQDNSLIQQTYVPILQIPSFSTPIPDRFQEYDKVIIAMPADMRSDLAIGTTNNPDISTRTETSI